MLITKTGICLNDIDIKKAVLYYILDNHPGYSKKRFKDMWISKRIGDQMTNIDLNSKIKIIVSMDEK